MYGVSVSRTVVAQHYLTVPNAGPEGTLHSHTFRIQATVRGPELNEYEYLVDIDELSAAMDETVALFRDQTLNDLSEFEDTNPSVERLCLVFGDHLCERISPDHATELEIEIQEDTTATVTHQRAL